MKNKGYENVLISGSPYDIIENLAGRIHADKIFATSYETENGIFTGMPLNNCAIKDVKREIVLNYIKERNFDLINSTGFGDSDHDLVFLEIVGRPVAIFPNEKLEREALINNWLICRDENSSFDRIREYLHI